MHKRPLSKTIIIATGFLTLSACQPPAGQSTNAANETKGSAKNVILFIGDGMGISTLTAARIFDGQSKGMSGEENRLSFENFPHLALVQTYNLDSQVPDSAGTASAMNTGLKTQIGKISVQPDGPFAGCANNAATPPVTFADLAEAAGMSTGVVSTARLTHATPAAVYGHAVSRGFENDKDLSLAAKERNCADLAAQLIAYGADNELVLALGGGRRNFLPESAGGRRGDGRDLTQEWVGSSDQHTYISDGQSLRDLDPTTPDKVLGLFNDSHMSYEVDREAAKEPSLSEMTTFAIKNSQARGGGYFLMIEAGRIDHAHHGTNAYRALSETQELSKAVAIADELTLDDDTLILVTADHSHTFTISGYPGRGNPILGLAHPVDRQTGKLSETPMKDKTGKPYTTLGYHNGQHLRAAGTELSGDVVTHRDYQQQVAVELDSETHGGEDVALFAKGPGAHRVKGLIDQKEIFDIMRAAAELE